jgi:glycosyltransferase involved in cell wall biosynthesis
MNLKIVVPVRNSEQWIGKCINSIAEQNYQGPWECLIVDDASTDGTVEKIKDAIDAIQSNEVQAKFKTKFNSKRVGALENFVDGFKILNAEQDPEAVLIQIDGDDWLFGPAVFQIINYAYQQTGCWITWGSYVEWPTGAPGMAKPLPDEAHKNCDYRMRPWVTSALRTFKSHLWYSIKDSDLRDDNGKYYDVTWDLAHMFPMIEMARERSIYIPYTLYCYNRETPFSDDKINRERQINTEKKIRMMKPYDRK